VLFFLLQRYIKLALPLDNLLLLVGRRRLNRLNMGQVLHHLKRLFTGDRKWQLDRRLRIARRIILARLLLRKRLVPRAVAFRSFLGCIHLHGYWPLLTLRHFACESHILLLLRGEGACAHAAMVGMLL
jgi:hypothetical protein